MTIPDQSKGAPAPSKEAAPVQSKETPVQPKGAPAQPKEGAAQSKDASAQKPHPIYQSHEGMPKGMSDSQVKLERLHLPKDLTGKRVLDVGCNEGFFCSVAVKRGASRVVGLDREARSLDMAKKLYGDLNIEFIRASWQKLPAGPFDLVIWTSAMHYEPDPYSVFTGISAVLAPGGTLILECGVSSGLNMEMVLHQRHSSSLWYPTLRYLQEVLLRDYAVRRVAYDQLTPGDPVPRSVFHCKKNLPSVVLIRGKPGDGKSWLSQLVGAKASKVVSLDLFVSRIARAKFHHTPLQKFIRDAYNPASLGPIYSGIDEQGLTADYAKLLAETVTPSDRLIVIEGAMTDAQAEALHKKLGATAFVWDTTRRK